MSRFCFPIKRLGEEIPYAVEEIISAEDVKTLVKEKICDCDLLIDNAFQQDDEVLANFVRVGEDTPTTLAVVREKNAANEQILRLAELSSITTTYLQPPSLPTYSFEDIVLVVLNLKKNGYDTPRERLFAFQPHFVFEVPYSDYRYKEIVFEKLCEATFLYRCTASNKKRYKQVASLCAAFKVLSRVQLNSSSVNELTLSRCLFKFMKWSVEEFCQPCNEHELLRRETQSLVNALISCFDDEMQSAIIFYVAKVASEGGFFYEADARSWVISLYRGRYHKNFFWQNFFNFWYTNCTEKYDDVQMANAYYASCLSLAYVYSCHFAGKLNLPSPGGGEMHCYNIVYDQVADWRQQFEDYRRLLEMKLNSTESKLAKKEVAIEQYDHDQAESLRGSTMVQLLLNAVKIFEDQQRLIRT